MRLLGFGGSLGYVTGDLYDLWDLGVRVHGI